MKTRIIIILFLAAALVVNAQPKTKSIVPFPKKKGNKYIGHATTLYYYPRIQDGVVEFYYELKDSADNILEKENVDVPVEPQSIDSTWQAEKIASELGITYQN